jgi:enoyl-CoA hydratase/carnithine racemase
MEYQQILFEKRDRILTITLNRPDKLNAYSERMVHEIIAALPMPAMTMNAAP